MALTEEQHAAVDAYLAKNAGPDAPLVKALLTSGEMSSGDPTAKSPKGARGLMQLTPIALKDLGRDPATFKYDSPSESLQAGIDYVRLLRDKYGFTNPLQIAAAYNAGPTAVKEAVAKGSLSALPEETQAYVKRMAATLPAAAPAPAAPSVGADVQAGGSTTAPSSAPQAPAPAPAPVQAADVSGPLAHAGSALVRGVTGAADAIGALASMTGPIKIPSATAAVDPYLAPRATSLPGRIAEGAIEAIPATVATGGMGVGNVVRGALSGGAAVAGGDVTEAAGLGRLPGELGGAIAPSLVESGVKALQASRLERQAEGAAREAAKTAAKDAEAGLGAATAGAQTAEEAAVRSAADAASAVEKTVQNSTPIERVTTLRDMVKNRAANIVKLGTADWENFLGRTDAASVMVPTGGLRFTAGGLVDDAVQNGLSRDAAIAKADRIMHMVADAEGTIRETMTFREAQALRSELGEIYGKATRGATQHRAGELYARLASQMDAALPEALKPAYDLLRASRREQARLLQNAYVRKVITNDPAGQATAEKYLSNVLDGKWSPARQVEVRTLAEVAGEEGKAVFGDALLRNSLKAATTRNGETNWAQWAKSLRDPNQYRDMTMAFLPAKEQQTLLHLADAAAEAAQKAELARGAVSGAGARAKAAQKALEALPDPSRSVLNVVMKASAVGALGILLRNMGVPATEVMLGEGYAGLRMLRDPANRAAFRRAARVSIDSVDGRRLLQSLVAGASVGQATNPTQTSPAAPATVAAPSVPGRP